MSSHQRARKASPLWLNGRGRHCSGRPGGRTRIPVARASLEETVSVRFEKSGSVWTVIHSRPEVRNAMDAESADALVAAFEAFDADLDASVAVFWGEGGSFCAGWDLKSVSSLDRQDPVGKLDFPEG